MGLDCSHDAWHGAYSAFNRLRQAVAWCMGGSWPPHFHISDYDVHDTRWWYDETKFDEDTHEGLFEFMNHSDCDGEISPKMCLQVADDLEAIIPRMELLCHHCFKSVGHIEYNGGFVQSLKIFIKGCREAHATNEPLLFR